MPGNHNNGGFPCPPPAGFCAGGGRSSGLIQPQIENEALKVYRGPKMNSNSRLSSINGVFRNPKIPMPIVIRTIPMLLPPVTFSRNCGEILS